MKVTIWGCRGSVPVSGSHFLRYGGATTCVEIQLPQSSRDTPDRVIIDAGTGFTEWGKSWRPGGEKTLFVQTHMHWDHIQGFPLARPLFHPETQMELWAVPREGMTLQEVLRDQMTAPMFPVALDMLPASLSFKTLDKVGRAQLGELSVEWTEVCHPSGSTAYRFSHRGSSFVFTGDVEVAEGSRAELLNLSAGADVVVMDSQYLPEDYAQCRGYGHSTPLDAVALAYDARVPHVIMTHHDPTHNDSVLDRKLWLARKAAPSGLIVDNAVEGMTFDVAVLQSSASGAAAAG